MTSFHRSGRRVLIALCLAAALPSVLRAAEPLTWKFTAGDVQNYLMTQKMEMTMDMGGGQTMNTTVNQDIHMTWKVDDVQADGTAKLTQRIERMKMHMEVPGQSMDFDSASEVTAEGPLAAQLAPVFKALTSASFGVTMSPRGEIIDVDVPEELIKALQSSPGAQLMGELTSKDGFKNLVQQGALTLPEELTEGNEWSSKVEVKNPMFGTQTVETTYRYTGSRDADGATMEVFAPTMVVDFAGAGGPADIKVAGQESSGEILFNRDAGRLESSSIKQGMDLQITAGGQSITQKIDQTIELKWVSPEDAAKQ